MTPHSALDVLTCAPADMANSADLDGVDLDGAIPIWAAIWSYRGPGMHVAAMDAAVAQVATEAALGDWA